MFCSQCGSSLDLNASFCSKCGLPINKAPSPVGQFSSLEQPATTPAQVHDVTALGTMWLELWNYVALPLGGVYNLLMTPAHGIILVPLAILQFAVAYGLYHRKPWAWRWNWVLLVIAYINISIYLPVPTHGPYGGTVDLVVQFVPQLLLGGLIWMWPNYVYWKKRKGLFY